MPSLDDLISGIDTGSNDSPKPEDDSLKGRLLAGVGVATSGQQFISAVTGGRVNTDNLPGYLAKPIDILASPVAIGSILAAPLTGGASLGELGALGAGRLALGAGTEALAGGLVGGVAANQVATRLPDNAPDWLKIGAPIAAGLVGGGVGARVVGSRVAGALGAFDTARAVKPAATGIENLLDLTPNAPGLTKTQQVTDYVRGIIGLDPKYRQEITPILGAVPKGERIATSMANDIQHRVTTISKDLGLDDKNTIEVGPAKPYTAPNPVEDDLAARGYTSGPIAKERPFFGSWISPEGKEVITNGIQHDEVDNGLDLINKGYVRRAGLGNYEVAPDASHQTLRALDKVIAADAPDLISAARGTGDTPEALVSFGNKTESLSPYADQRATQLANIVKKGYVADERTTMNSPEMKATVQALRDAPEGPEKEAARQTLIDAQKAASAAGRPEFSTVEPPTEPAIDPQLALHNVPSEATRVPIQDVAAKLPLYADRLKPEQLISIRSLGEEFSQWKDYANKVGRKIGDRPDVMEGGYYIPRGRPVEDGTDGLVFPGNSSKRFGGQTGAEKGAVYGSVAEGQANGETYPALDKAAYDYVNGVGKAVVGQHAATQLSQLKDLDGNPLFVTSANGAPRGMVPVEGMQGYYGSPSDASYVNNVLNPQDLITKGADFARGVNSPLRALHTTLDFAFNTRTGPVAFINHPIEYMKALKTGYQSITNPSVVGKIYDGINMRAAAGEGLSVRDMAHYGLQLSAYRNEMQSPLLEQLPKVGGLINKASRAYGSFTDTIRPLMMETALKNASAAGKTLDPADIAAAVNHATGASTGGVPKNADAFIQFPSWLQSQFQLFGDAMSKGGYQGSEARMALAKLATLGTTSTVLLNKLQGHDTTYVAGATIGIGDHQIGVPLLRVGDQKIDVFGPYGSLVAGMLAAAHGDVGYLIRSKASPLVQLGWDWKTGTDFQGNPVNFDDPMYWAKVMAPYGVGSVGDHSPAVALLDSAGVRANDVTPYQKLQDTAKRFNGKDWADYTGTDKQAFAARYPDYFKDLNEQTKEHAAAGDPHAKGIVATQGVNDTLTSQQNTLFGLLQSGRLAPNEFRDALNTANQNAAVAKQQIRADYDLDKTQKVPSAIQSAISGYYDLFDKADVGVIAGGAKTGKIDWDAFDQLQKDYLSTLSPAQQNAIDQRVSVHSPQLDWYYNNKNLIQQSGYYDTVGTAFDRMQASISKAVPGAQSFNDLVIARNQAQAKGDKSLFAYTSALINRVQSQAGLYKKVMLAKNPALQKALIQNGYITAPKGTLSTPDYS